MKMNSTMALVFSAVMVLHTITHHLFWTTSKNWQRKGQNCTSLFLMCYQPKATTLTCVLVQVVTLNLIFEYPLPILILYPSVFISVKQSIFINTTCLMLDPSCPSHALGNRISNATHLVLGFNTSLRVIVRSAISSVSPRYYTYWAHPSLYQLFYSIMATIVAPLCKYG